MPISDELIDQLLEGSKNPEDILGEEGILKELTKRLAERALEAEMTEHLGYDKHDPAGANSGNSRNGKSRKRVRSSHGHVELEVPRDRNGDFKPRLVGKGERQLSGFDERIVSLYARGMTTRDIRAHLAEVYGVDVSPSFISRVTDEVMDEVRAWQGRPLDPVYPIVWLDALVVRVRSSGGVRNKSVYLALGVNVQGEKELLGLWMAETEGAKFWASVVSELQNRGLRDILVACTDGLKGFPEAIGVAYPDTSIQLCIVHQVRHSLRFVGWKQRKAVAADLKAIYSAATMAEAELALEAFCERWDSEHPVIGKSWRANWERLSVFFSYPPDIRKVIYTTNAIESMNASVRKVIKTRRCFPDDDAVMKLMYLALNNISRKWTMPVRNWKKAMQQFMIMSGERLEQ